LEILPKLFRRLRDLPIMVAGQPEDGSGPVTLPTQPSRERINTRHQFQRLRPGGHEVPWGLQNRLARIIRPDDGHTVMLAADHGHDSLVNLGKLVDEGEEVGIPVLAVTAVGKELEKRDARYLGLACRIAAEFGAHFVKTYFCDDFSKVVESCPVPLVVAGGP